MDKPVYVVSGWLNGRFITSKPYAKLGNAKRAIGDRKQFPNGTEDIRIQRIQDGKATEVEG